MVTGASTSPVSGGLCVLSRRYALAIEGVWSRRVLGLHECRNPACASRSHTTAQHKLHVVSGFRATTWSACRRCVATVAAMPCDVSTVAVYGGNDSVALHEAVPNGWDAAAVQAVLLGDQPTLRCVWAPAKDRRLGVGYRPLGGQCGPVAAGVTAMS